VPLSPPEWSYPIEALAAAITPRTRVLMLNDPLNPAGTVASEAELAAIAELCVARDLTAICDEVWEDVRFDGVAHRLSASGMPTIDGSLAQIDCSIESVTSAGDHYFVLGRVRDVTLDASAGDAMVFYKSAVTGVSEPDPR